MGRSVKKTICGLCLLIAFSITVLGGCGVPAKEFGEPIQAYDKEIIINVGNSSDETGFAVKEKKYVYDNTNVLILNVENQTNKNYSVTVSCSFFDQNGDKISEQTQGFEGWQAGYSNYFIFRPNVMFDVCEYRLEAEEYSGECYAAYLELNDFFGIKLRESKRNSDGRYSPEGYVAADGVWNVKNLYDGELAVSPIYIFFDNKGEIYMIDDRLQSVSFPKGTSEHCRRLFVTDCLWGNKAAYALPAELGEGVNSLVAILRIGTAKQE